MRSKRMHYALATITAASCVLLLGGQCTADTHFVSPDGSDEYPYLKPETAASSIQAAVDAAQPGDSVQISAGEYREQVQLRERLCLRGAGSKLTTILRPSAAGDYVILGAADARTQDLSVKRDEFERNCDGILLVDAPNQVVDNCSVSGSFRRGISCLGPVVGAPSVIVQTSVSGAGVGAWCEGFVVLDRCTLQGNTWGAWTGYSEVLISGCDFLGNAMGIYPWYTRLTIECTRFVGGEAAIGQDEDYFVYLTMLASLITGTESAFRLYDSGELTLINCTLSDNELVFDLQRQTVELVNCILWGNKTVVQEWPSQGTLTALYSDIQGGWEGQGNIVADPRFLDPGARDFRLRRDSPCIDAGTTSLPGLPPVQGPSRDLEGKRMPAYGGHTKDLFAYPDMGAYEHYFFAIGRDEESGLPSLTWASFYYRSAAPDGHSTYSVFYSDDLINWHVADANVHPWDPGLPYKTWVDDGSKTGLPPSLAPKRFYRVLENP